MADAEVAGHGGGCPQQADQRAGCHQGDRDVAGLGDGELWAERAGDLARVAELAYGRLGSLVCCEPGGAVRVNGVQEPGPQLVHNAGAGPGGAWQPGDDLGQVGVDQVPRGRT